MDSKSRKVKTVFNFISEEGKEAITDFYFNNTNRQYKAMNEMDIMMIDNQVDDDIKDALTCYTSYEFININNALRNRWNYEENGHISRMEESMKTGRKIISYIRDNQKSLGNIQVYRGVDLDYFRDYGINSIEELKDLEGDYLIDAGLVSTSLMEDKIFHDTNNGMNKNYNIEIRYNIPEEFGDGIFVGDMSCISGECEYLINSYNIAKITNVEIDDGKATIDTLLIPKQLYDKNYMKEERRVK